MSFASISAGGLDVQTLSYGFELEFIIHGYDQDENATSDQEDLRRSEVAALLTTVLPNVRHQASGLEPTLSEPVNKLVPLKYHYWNVDTDHTVRPAPDTKTEGPVVCEVSSAVLYSGPQNRMTEQQRDTVYDVCRAIRNNHPTRVNDTCGLHVHIGECGETIAVETVRRLLLLVWAAEPVLIMLLPAYRHDCIYLLPLSQTSALACRPEGSKEGEGAKWAEFANGPWPQAIGRLVAGAQDQILPEHAKAFKLIGHLSLDELATVALCPGFRMSLSLHGTSKASRSAKYSPPGTVESRYMPGTLEPEIICDTVDLWLGMYHAARHWDESKFASVFSGLYDRAWVEKAEKGALAELLLGLDLMEQFPQWAAYCLDGKRGAPINILSKMPRRRSQPT